MKILSINFVISVAGTSFVSNWRQFPTLIKNGIIPVSTDIVTATYSGLHQICSSKSNIIMNSGTLVGQSLDKNMFNHPGHLPTEDSSPPPRDQVWVTRPEAKPATTLRAWRHRKCAHSPFISPACDTRTPAWLYHAPIIMLPLSQFHQFITYVSVSASHPTTSGFHLQTFV